MYMSKGDTISPESAFQYQGMWILVLKSTFVYTVP